jgi:hypothetical protein
MKSDLVRAGGVMENSDADVCRQRCVGSRKNDRGVSGQSTMTGNENLCHEPSDQTLIYTNHRGYRRASAHHRCTRTHQRRLSQGTTLPDASTWPDNAGRQISEMDLCHVINFPKEANTYDQQRDYELRNCIIEAIPWYLSVLSSPDAPRMRSVLLCGSSRTSSGTCINRCTSPGRRPGGEGEYGPGQ